MKHVFFLIIIPFLFIPSVYADQKALVDDDRVWRGAGVVGTTTSCAVAFSSNSTTEEVDYDNASLGGQCKPIAYQWNLDFLPADATITNVTLEFDIDAKSASSMNCQIYHMDRNLWKHAGAAIWTDLDNGTQYASGETICQTVGNDKQINLGATAITDLQSQLDDTDIFGVSILRDPHTRVAGSDRLIVLSDVQLYVEYTITLDGVTDLTASEVRGTGVTLSWSTPTTTGTIVGYQVNDTTPHSENVATILTNDTGSGSTTAIISQLTGETPYSFRVGSRINDQLNASGNVLNITTLFDPTKAFTPGTFNITDTGTDLRDIRFTEIDLTATSKRLNVTFPQTFTNLKCDLSYEFAQTNRTYENLDSIVDSSNAGYNITYFDFTNVDNEIITANCWDSTQGNGTYVIEQTSIPFVNQIKQFQNGDFGTSGDFGAVDLVTLLVFGVIATMGFNRKNEAVGAFFLFALTFGLSWFGIITIPTAMGGVIAVVILIVITQVRKD